MKNINLKQYIILSLTGLLCIVIASCERGFSDDIDLATFPVIPEVFTDTPVNLTDDFFISFNPADGANVNGFGTDDDVAYQGSTSIRIDVPGVNDPEGNFIGGIFRDRGEGRNLTSYDALTFWARGSTTATVGLVGFGTDFIKDKFAVGLQNIDLSTDWKKYIIPIPDPSKLVQEKGMFIFSAGTQSTNGLGYTFWLDEIRFEKLGTIGQPRPAIYNGEDVTEQSFIDSVLNITSNTQTFHFANGEDVTVNVAEGYMLYQSSDPTVVQVNEQGQIIVVGEGTAVITATLGGIDAQGSLTIQSLGEFDTAPVPTLPASNVISIFSDAYTNVPIDFYNGYWEPYQTTESADFVVNGDNILNYTNFNFVGNSFANPTVDASAMTHIHFDIFVPGTLDSSAQMLITLRDLGADGVDGGTDDTNQTININNSDLASDAWVSIEVPLTIANKNNLGLLIYENLGSNLTNFYLDNVYFHN